MHQRNIFFDLDGTLLDARMRLYRLFSDLVPASVLTFNEYWQLKREKKDHKYILGQLYHYSDEALAAFQQEWMERIETAAYLDLDKPFCNMVAKLQGLAATNNLFVVSHRQHDESALYQLAKWQMDKYFQQVLITRQQSSKAALIQQHCTNLQPSDIFVGDTGEDIRTAQSLGIKSVAVLSGFLNREMLNSYLPDYIFETAADIDFSLVK